MLSLMPGRVSPVFFCFCWFPPLKSTEKRACLWGVFFCPLKSTKKRGARPLRGASSNGLRLVAFNFRAVFIATTFVSGLAGVARVYGLLINHWTSIFLGYATFVLFLNPVPALFALLLFWTCFPSRSTNKQTGASPF